MSSNHTEALEGAQFNMTPYVLAHLSRDFHLASESYSPTDIFPIVNFYLYCASIELGLKAAILSFGNTDTAKAKNKQIGHDLIAAHAEYESKAGKPLFDTAELAEIAKVNPLFKAKALEYFLPDMMVSMLRAFTNFPTLADIRNASLKVRSLLAANGEFINA
jgi:hypothetical protein